MGEVIDITRLINDNYESVYGMISPAKERVDDITVKEHAAQPIKSLDDIYKVSNFLIYNKRYRDNMMFIVGINFGLRVSDLMELRFCNLINDNFTYKDSVPVFEKKTRETRKKKINRHITINRAVKEAVNLFLRNTSDVSLSDYMFRSESGRGMNENKPLSRQSVDRILKGMAFDVGLNIRISTHTLRKTFCYHQMVMSNNDPRKLYLLQKMLNHSSVTQTLEYIGITDEEIKTAYKELNLGASGGSYLMDSKIIEFESEVV